MEYKLKYVNLTDEQINKVKAMHIPNTDDNIDNDLWKKNAFAIMDSEIEASEEAIAVFLNK